MGFAKTGFLVIVLLILGALWMLPARAQQPGNCSPALAENALYINNVRARIFNNGALFWRGSPHVYEVPKGGGANAIFTAGVWVGGLVGGELRVAAARYGRFHFWPGPLNDDATLPNPNDCSPFDKIYKISRADVQVYEDKGEITLDLRDWPYVLGAPVIDGDGIPGHYNLAGGDRPEVLGHQTLWWVMNDVGNVHLPSPGGSPPIGLEVQATVFAAAFTVEAIDNSTLYRYRLINKGPKPLEEAYFSVFTDPDLGNFDDDCIGSDTTLGIGFFYNSDNEDEGRDGYGKAPPADGVIGQAEEVTLWWQKPSADVHHQLQVSTRPDFSTLVADADSLVESHFTLRDLAEDSTYYWRLRTFNQVGTPGVWTTPWRFTVGVGLPLEASEQPSEITLLANYPNPFNPSTTIWFGLSEPGDVRLSIYNVLGQRVAVLIDEGMQAGWHKTQWKAETFSSGVYFYRLESQSRVATRPMMLVK